MLYAETYNPAIFETATKHHVLSDFLEEVEETILTFGAKTKQNKIQIWKMSSHDRVNCTVTMILIFQPSIDLITKCR